MSSVDFTNMTRRDLFHYRLKATKAHERPSVENNYFTTKYSVHLSHKQPADWIPTKLARLWCEHHGPANHSAAQCPGIYGKTAKPVGEPKADAKTRARKAANKLFIAAKIREARARQAAKRSNRATDGMVLVIRERPSQS
ncbi:hypothetical protein MBLNU13_g08207t1 [Cladosporium sp. NU13]